MDSLEPSLAARPHRAAPSGCNMSATILRFRTRAAALLEVVVSLSILMVAMAVVGATFRNCYQNAELTDLLTRSMMETERLLAEMDAGLLDIKEQEQSGWFGDEGPPGMSWRVEVTPHENMPDLLDVDIHIFLGDPDASDDEHRRLLTTRVQRPEPRGIDFEKDFGLDQDQIDALTDAIPGGAGVFDPQNFDPRSLAALDLDQIVDLLPTLIQAFGGGFVGSGYEDKTRRVCRTSRGVVCGAGEYTGGG